MLVVSGSGAEIVEYGPGGVVAGGTGDFATRMGPCAAEVKALDGGPVVGPADERAPGEHLGRDEVDMVGVTVCHAEPGLEVGWGEEVRFTKGTFEVGDVGGEPFDDLVCDGLAKIIPGAGARGDGCVEHSDGQMMLPGWGEAWIESGGDLDFQDWSLGQGALPGFGSGSLEGFHGWAEAPSDDGLGIDSGTGAVEEAGEIRGVIESGVEAEGGGPGMEVAGSVDERFGEG